MSIQAWLWALYTGPRPTKPHQLPVLLVLADKADETGQGAFPSVDTLAYCAGKDRRQIQKDLGALEEQGLIRRGNPARVAYIRVDRRPVVYDLALELRRTDPAPWERDSSDNAQDSYPQAKSDVSAVHDDGVNHSSSREASGVNHSSPRSDDGVNHSSSREASGVNCGTERGEPQFTRPFLDPEGVSSSSLSSSSHTETPEKDKEEERGISGQGQEESARIDYAAVAASLLEVEDAGWRRLGKKVRSDLALAVQQLIEDGADPDAITAAIRAYGPLRGPTVKSPQGILLYRLRDLDASALTNPPRAAERASQGNSGASKAPSGTLCRMGSACRDGQWVCDLDCPDGCTGRHDPRGRACPDCAGTNDMPAGPTFEQQLTKAMGTQSGLMAVDGYAA